MGIHVISSRALASRFAGGRESRR